MTVTYGAQPEYLTRPGHEVTLWLSVIWDQGLNSTGDLWTKKTTTAFLPDLDDSIYLWADPEDGATGGPSWTTRRRFMDANGYWHLELIKMVVDPNDGTRSYMMGDQARGGPPMWDVWNTDVDGDPVPLLRRGGWERYGED